MTDRLLLPQPLRIIQVVPENPFTKTFILDGALAAHPGQFVMAWLPGYEDKPFSLAGANPISLTVAAVGPLSRAIHGLQQGDRLWIRGPLGQGYALAPEPGRLLLIGGGYGVAPLHYLAREALKLGHQPAAIIGARRAQDLLLVDAFTALQIPLWLTTEDSSQGLPGRVTDAFAQILATGPRPHLVCACGPIGMLAAVARQCEAAALPFQIGWEAHMRCGIGLCGSCEVGQGWLTCLDGPVFGFDPVKISPFEAAR